jgi:hypothetical protein
MNAVRLSMLGLIGTNQVNLLVILRFHAVGQFPMSRVFLNIGHCFTTKQKAVALWHTGRSALIDASQDHTLPMCMNTHASFLIVRAIRWRE